MTQEKIIQQIEKHKNNLPAWDAHSKMMPPHRGLFNEQEIFERKPRNAAVLILMYLKGSSVYFPLLERHEYDGNHSSEIGLPGGKKEDFDADFEATAIRETEEEIGISKESISTIFSLSRLYIPPSNFLVYPFVGIFENEINYKLDTREVKELIEIPLQDFLHTTEIIEYNFQRKEMQYTVPAYYIQNKIVWGATAMILTELKDILLK